MTKKLLLSLFSVFFVISVSAQTNSKQMQKLETRVDFEYVTFANSAKQQWINTTQMNLQDFYKSLLNAQKVSRPASLSIVENNKLNFKNGVSKYIISSELDLVEDFSGIETEFQYLSSNSERAFVLFRLNSQKFQLDLSKNTVFLTPLGNGFLAAFRLITVKKRLAVCSIDEIGEEIINKKKPDWIKKCYDAGSPELKEAESEY